MKPMPIRFRHISERFRLSAQAIGTDYVSLGLLELYYASFSASSSTSSASDDMPKRRCMICSGLDSS